MAWHQRLSFGLCVATIVGSTRAQNLVVNGSFEDPQHANLTVDDGLGRYWYRRLNSPALTGWTHDSPIAVLRTRPGFWLSQDGTQYLELESGFGSFTQQTILTTPGQQYTLGFWYASNPYVSSGSLDDSIRVSWDGGVIDLVDGSDTTNLDIAWSYFQYTVTATGSTTVLRFEDGFHGTSTNGGFLDNVSVVAVPGVGSLGVLSLGVLPLMRRHR